MFIPSTGKKWLFSSGVDGIEQVREGDWQRVGQVGLYVLVCPKSHTDLQTSMFFNILFEIPTLLKI